MSPNSSSWVTAYKKKFKSIRLFLPLYLSNTEDGLVAISKLISQSNY